MAASFIFPTTVCLCFELLIIDNVLIAAKIMHYPHTKRQGQVGNMAVKLDMSKTYDNVAWNFLEIVMLKMGLHDTPVNLIMNCVRFTSLLIIINETPKSLIHPSRGFR